MIKAQYVLGVDAAWTEIERPGKIASHIFSQLIDAGYKYYQ